MKFCTNCGKEIKENALFCIYCGSKVDDGNYLEKNNDDINGDNANEMQTENNKNVKYANEPSVFEKMFAWMNREENYGKVSVLAPIVGFLINLWTLFKTHASADVAIIYTLVATALGIVGCVFSAKAKEKSLNVGSRIVGLILSNIQIILSIVVLLLIFLYKALD